MHDCHRQPQPHLAPRALWVHATLRRWPLLAGSGRILRPKFRISATKGPVLAITGGHAPACPPLTANCRSRRSSAQSCGSRAMPRVTFVLHPCHDQVPFVPQSCSLCAPVPPPSQLRNRTKQNIMEHIFQQSTDLPPAQLRFLKCNQRADAVSMALNSPTGPVTHG